MIKLKNIMNFQIYTILHQNLEGDYQMILIIYIVNYKKNEVHKDLKIKKNIIFETHLKKLN